MEIEGLGKHVCSSFAQTARFLQMLDRCVRDFDLETGEQFPLDSLASVISRAVDSDPADRMEETGVDLKNFMKVEEFIKKRESRLRSRVGGAGRAKGPDAMVHGVAAAEAAAAPPGTSAAAAETPLLDPWACSAVTAPARARPLVLGRLWQRYGQGQR